VVRNFHRPVPSLGQHLANTPRQQFFHFVGVMNLLQEQVARVIHNNDISHVELVSRSALQTAAPDPKAAELRDRLLVILSKLTQASRNQQRMDQGLTDEFKTWHEDYMEWFKGAH
jgi:hypothetical protein